MKKERVALIGYGYWGKKIFRYLKQGEHFNVVYVYFPSLRKLSKDTILHDYGREFVDSIDVIWKDRTVPHVIIATPIKTHFALVKEALRHSKNVLVEKPMAETKKEALLLKKMAMKKHRVLMTEYTYTFSDALQKARDIVLKGVIGKIESIEIHLKQLGRFLDRDVYTLLGSHALSILGLFVPLTRCRFSAQTLTKTNKIATAGVISFKSVGQGPKGLIDLTLHFPPREKKVYVYGEKGTLLYDQYAKTTLMLTTYSKEKSRQGKELVRKVKSFPFDERHNVRLALRSFYKVLGGRKDHNVNESILISALIESFKK